MQAAAACWPHMDLDSAHRARPHVDRARWPAAEQRFACRTTAYYISANAANMQRFGPMQWVGQFGARHTQCVVVLLCVCVHVELRMGEPGTPVMQSPKCWRVRLQ